MTTITAVDQTGYRALVSVDTATEPATSTVTVYRDGDTVRGGRDLPAGSTVVLVDYEVPLNRPVFYQATVTAVDGSSATSSAVPITVPADLPVLTDPVTGVSARVTVERWPELRYRANAAALHVAGRRAPIVVADVMSAAESAAELRVDDAAQLAAARALLGSGQALRLRAACLGVDDAWLAPAGYVETRVTNSADDARRRLRLDAWHVDMPYPDTPAVGDSLADLAAAEPGVLADIAARWVVLIDIATTDLQALA